MSARRTDATESGSWATPQAHDGEHGEASRGPNGTSRGADLMRQTREWSTPTTEDDTNRATKYQQGGKALCVHAREWQTPAVADTEGGRLTRGGTRSHEPLLKGQVQQWPTPTTQDAENLAGPSQQARNSDPLNVAAAHWPTPIEGDAAQSGGRMGNEKAHAGVSLTDATVWGQTASQQDRASRSAHGSRLAPSRLNPAWVEALMGFPVGWLVHGGATLSVPWAIASSHSVPKS